MPQYGSPLFPSLGNTDSSKEPEQAQELLKTNLQENIQHIKNSLGNSSDIVIREIQIGSERQIKAAIIYTDGLADSKSIQNFIMESLMLNIANADPSKLITSQEDIFQVLKDHFLTAGSVTDVTEWGPLLTSLLSGDAILLLEGYTQGFSIGMRGWKDRAVSETTTETVIRGPKEGFTENLRTNTALIRRKIKDPNLWLETKEIGRVTKTDVAINHVYQRNCERRHFGRGA